MERWPSETRTNVENYRQLSAEVVNLVVFWFTKVAFRAQKARGISTSFIFTLVVQAQAWHHFMVTNARSPPPLFRWPPTPKIVVLWLLDSLTKSKFTLWLDITPEQPLKQRRQSKECIHKPDKRSNESNKIPKKNRNSITEYPPS